MLLGWKDLWEDNVFPWHKEDVHPKLMQNLDILVQTAGKSDPKNCKFFVPLCGKSIDMIFLHNKGFHVIGCEAVEKAVVDFFNENSIEYDKKEISDEISVFDAKTMNIKIVCGDYFKLTPDIVGGKMDCIFDRGSLVAIDKEQRTEYELQGV